MLAVMISNQTIRVFCAEDKTNRIANRSNRTALSFGASIGHLDTLFHIGDWLHLPSGPLRAIILGQAKTYRSPNHRTQSPICNRKASTVRNGLCIHYSVAFICQLTKAHFILSRIERTTALSFGGQHRTRIAAATIRPATINPGAHFHQQLQHVASATVANASG